MLIYLEKVRRKTLFSRFEPIVTEPLELLYIKSVLDSMGIENGIIDPLFSLEASGGDLPDMVILTGYNVAEEEMKKRAHWWKNQNRDILVMVSGVHVQLNSGKFMEDYIDFIFHTQDFGVFKELLYRIQREEEVNGLTGLHTRKGDGSWELGEERPVQSPEAILPSRDLYKSNKDRTRYVDKKGLALVKGGRGCPYACSYCYCRSLNGGTFVRPDFSRMFEEMETIGADHYWIVDDVLLVDSKDAMEFIRASRDVSFEGGIIAYLKADFIVREREFLKDLRDGGLSEVIIGFETPDREELLDYNKKVDVYIYEEAISLLKDNNIQLTALFMVHPDYGLGEFWRLWTFILKNRLDLYTISIFTPLPGSDEFLSYQDRLTTDKAESFDFLHLVLPSRLPRPVFYGLFYLSHLKLLFSKRILKYILMR
ncbi:MAG TPA: radical SAM protein [Tissierellaceae bacterium]|nr:radical SAM protein [Tissierellaceae bacterium]